MNTKLFLRIAGVVLVTPLLSAAAPSDEIATPAWIRDYGDDRLNHIVSQGLQQNADLEVALARQRSAAAGIAIARSGFFPQLAAGGSWTRRRDPALNPTTGEDYSLGGQLSWEIDLAGRVRHLNRSARASAEAVRATTDAVRLQLVADIATTYFASQASTREVAVIAEGVTLRERAKRIIDSRANAGAATDLDVARAESEWAAAQADLAEARRMQAQVTHALSTLAGTSALDAPIAEGEGLTRVPVSAAPALPSDLLLRRPDVYSAAREFASATALIGVARADFFPRVDLLGTAGYVSADSSTLTDWASRAWSLGPRVYLPLFQGGRNKARLNQAIADADAAEATYRGVVLRAVQEIATALSDRATLLEESTAQQRQLAAARRAAALSLRRFEAGAASYLEVIDAERTRLDAERRMVRLEAAELIAHVTLIKAVGGDWSAPGAPTAALAQK